IRVRFLKPVPDCRICRCVPSPQSIRKRYSSCLTICAERPRFAEGADAEVPRNNISNKAKSLADRICHRVRRDIEFNFSQNLCGLCGESLKSITSQFYPKRKTDHLCYTLTHASQDAFIGSEIRCKAQR